MNQAARLRVFIDADVLFAGAASPNSQRASLVVLRLAEMTLIDAWTSQQVIDECSRNLTNKLPAALPLFQTLVQRCLHLTTTPKADEIAVYAGLADIKDLPIITAAIREDCPWLLTFNVRHFQPGHPSVKVVRPGEFVQHVRYLLAYLSSPSKN